MELEDLSLSLDVDTDDYAKTAADDTPTTSSRGKQSDADFEAQMKSYVARFDNGDIYKSLPSKLLPSGPGPVLDAVEGAGDPNGNNNANTDNNDTVSRTAAKAELSRKQIQLVTAAAGELYFFQRYGRLLELIGWLRASFAVERDRKLEGALQRWEGRCRDKMEEGEAAARNPGEEG